MVIFSGFFGVFFRRMGYLDKKPPLFIGIDEMLASVVKIWKKNLWGKKFFIWPMRTCFWTLIWFQNFIFSGLVWLPTASNWLDFSKYFSKFTLFRKRKLENSVPCRFWKCTTEWSFTYETSWLRVSHLGKKILNFLKLAWSHKPKSDFFFFKIG